MAKKVFCAIDLGSQTTKILFFEQKQDSFSLVSKKEIETEGVREGLVVNPEKLSLKLKNFFSHSKEELKSFSGEALVALNGTHLFSLLSKGTVSVSRADQIISQEDIERAIEEAKKVSLSFNKKVLDFFPFCFQIDGEEEVKNPLKLKGIKLDAKGIVVGCSLFYFENLKEAILNSGLEILDIFPGPVASSFAIFTKREKEIGCAFLDLGAQTTSLAIFEKENLVHLSVLPEGCEKITKEIALKLKIDFEVAKKIQKEFFLEKNHSLTELSLPEPIKISPKKIAAIFERAIMEIFSLVAKELKKIQKEKLPGGIILLGGGSEIPQVLKLAKRKFNLPVKKGRIFFDPTLETKFATCAGLILLFQKTKPKEKGFFKKIKEFIQGILP